MDDSLIAGPSKFPEGQDPLNEWTIEELLHWSLDQYHNKAVDQTAQNIASLKLQCEKECEDVMTLHSMAVNNIGKKKDDGKSGSSSSSIGDDENRNPQSEHTTGTAEEISSKSNSTTAEADAIKSSSASVSTIKIIVIVGPQASSEYTLCPKPGTPCFVGRSKGKKFAKNGLSLHMDQEVSTTHGKFVSEGGLFYFIDVGSTNGSVYEGKQLEPKDLLLLVDGMELKVGNSVLKILLS